MPCDTVTTVELRLRGDTVKMELLKETIERFGVTVRREGEVLAWRTGSYDRRTGILSERSDEEANRIRKSYAARLTTQTLGRGGWQIKIAEE